MEENARTAHLRARECEGGLFLETQSFNASLLGLGFHELFEVSKYIVATKAKGRTCECQTNLLSGIPSLASQGTKDDSAKRAPRDHATAWMQGQYVVQTRERPGTSRSTI